LDQLRAWRPDVVATVAYGALLPESALTIPPHGWINLHFSLLPAWRGAAPVQRAIWAGDPITGATTFQIVKELDAGPVYGVVTYEVPPRATSGQVLEALSFDGAKLLVATMDLVASGEARPEPQSLEGLSHAPKVTVEEARVDWNRPANAVDRQIRACTPSPGAWTTFRGKRLKVGPLAPPAASSPEHLLNDQRSGAVIGLKDRVLVRTATELVALGEVEPAGKGWMDAAAWARGVRVDSGDWNGRGWEGKERFGE
jgi:methionyl-tRNA formyltransferase